MNKKKFSASILFLIIFLFVAEAYGKPWIITKEEAALPDMVRDINSQKTIKSNGPISAHQEIATGPIIVVEKPEDDALYNDLIDILIHFKKNPLGEKVNMDSLRIIYLKLFGIDITDRLKPYINETTIDATKIKFPEGYHEFEIRIQDAEEIESTKLVSVRVQ